MQCRDDAAIYAKPRKCSKDDRHIGHELSRALTNNKAKDENTYTNHNSGNDHLHFSHM